MSDTKRERETERLRSNHPGGPVPSISYTKCRVSPVELNTHTDTHTHTHVHKTAGRSSPPTTPQAQPSDQGVRGVKLDRLCYKTVRVKWLDNAESMCPSGEWGWHVMLHPQRRKRSLREAAQCRPGGPPAPRPPGGFLHTTPVPVTAEPLVWILSLK